MVSVRSCVVAATTTFSVLDSFVQAAPLAEKLGHLGPSARDVLRRWSAPAAPRFVVYSDRKGSLPHVSDLQGYNVFALSFLLTSGAVDQALVWQELTAGQRSSYMQEYHDAGISLIVSAFGSNQAPTSSGVDPTSMANMMADWVIKYGVDGLDVDYEDFTAFNNGAAQQWLITYTRQLRERLPQGQYILTHSPIAPWFSASAFKGRGYLAVDESVGSLIDWYNVQFYNQGSSEYTTCSGLLSASSKTYPQSALFQIIDSGIRSEKLVLGKPATTADCKNGYMDPSTLSSCISQATSKGWNGGVMVWQFPDASSSWIRTVRGDSWPV